MRRALRRWVAAFTLLGILGLQGALAAHACAMTLLPPDHSHAAISNAMSGHCAALAPKSTPRGSTLCLEHCTKGKDASGSTVSTDAPAPLSVAVLHVPDAITADAASGAALQQRQFRNNSPPPLALSPRLRI